MSKPIDLAGLVTARMCHDFANPLGAIGNGLELLELSGRALGEEGALIQDSLRVARARLSIFRITYGTHGNEDQVSQGDVEKLEAAWNMDTRLQVELPQQDFAKQGLQRIFLALQCIETAFPRGGSAVIKAIATGVEIAANGQKMVLKPETWGVFENPDLIPDLDPKTVQFGVLCSLGITPTITTNNDTLTLTL